MRIFLLIILVLFLPSCSQSINPKSSSSNNIHFQDTDKPILKPKINMEGNTIATRFNVPKEFKRFDTPENSFSNYLQNYPLKQNTINSEDKNSLTMSILDINTTSHSIKSSKDMLIKLLSEYLYKNRLYSKIHFHNYDGFNLNFQKWSRGFRITLDNGKLSWEHTGRASKDYNSYKEFLNIVYEYSTFSTVSSHLKPVKLLEMKIGDIFINDDSPENYAIVVDMAQNPINEGIIFILAQYDVETREIYIVENIYIEELSPWYSIAFEGNLELANNLYSKMDLKSFSYLNNN